MFHTLTQKNTPSLKYVAITAAVLLVLAGIFAANKHLASRVDNGLIAYYDFTEGQGDTIYDRSGSEKPIDLLIMDPSGVEWVEGIGLSIHSETAIYSISNAVEIKKAIEETQAVSIEAWLKPGSITQNGPARIVSYSKDAYQRNFTLGQNGQRYVVRMRTDATSDNGLPNTNTLDHQVSQNYIQHLVYTWNGQSGQEKIYIDGVQVHSGTRAGALNNWDSSFQLVLGNEANGARKWLGELYQVALYNAVLSPDEVEQNFSADFSKGKVPLGNYGLGKDIDTYFKGINNNVPVSLDIPDPHSIDSIIVELVYKGNPGSSLSFSDAEGNTYTADRHRVAGVYAYRKTIPPTSRITYSNTSYQSYAQSLVAYAYRSGNADLLSEVMVTDVGGYNSVETFGTKLPPTAEARNIHIELPITELTYDDRILSFTARAGAVDTSFTIQWGPSGQSFPEGCCLDIVEIDLLNVPGQVAQVVVSIESPYSAGQSYALSGIISLELSPSSGNSFPLEWLGIRAAWEGTSARINWATFAEENTDFFEVERASDGKKFETIGRISARGSIDKETAYDFVDQEGGQYAELYYRIRQVDLDGSFSLSDQVVLLASELTEMNMRIAPNPTPGPLEVRLEGAPQTESALLQVMNLEGKVLIEENLLQGLKKADLDLSSFAPGIYLLRYTSGEHVLAKRIQKK